jgi:lysozyme
MVLSPAGEDLIEGFESLRLEAYKDLRGIWTIGFGHTGGVKEGDTCTKVQADLWFMQDSQIAQATVNNSIKVPMKQNEFDAMVSLAYNIGAHAFANSEVVMHFNAGDQLGAANAFLNWHTPNLMSRRVKERQFFLRAA